LWTCIQREIYEETNVHHVAIENVIDIVPKYSPQNISLLVVFLVSATNVEKLSCENAECNENIRGYKWIDRNDFIKMDKEDFIDVRIYSILYKYFMLHSI